MPFFLFSEMASTIKEALKRIRERYGISTTNFIDELEAHGKRILQECAEEADYENDTYNLIDSYAYGVYYHGKLVRYGFVTPTKRATKQHHKMWGRDEVKAYLEGGYTPEGVYDLVIVASMFYGGILEAGKPPLKRKYRVISGAYDKLDRVKLPPGVRKKLKVL